MEKERRGEECREYMKTEEVRHEKRHEFKEMRTEKK